jgi:hypothetical protein
MTAGRKEERHPTVTWLPSTTACNVTGIEDCASSDDPPERGLAASRGSHHRCGTPVGGFGSAGRAVGSIRRGRVAGRKRFHDCFVEQPFLVGGDARASARLHFCVTSWVAWWLLVDHGTPDRDTLFACELTRRRTGAARRLRSPPSHPGVNSNWPRPRHEAVSQVVIAFRSVVPVPATS